MKISSSLLATVAAAAAIVGLSQPASAEWPEKPIQVIVPFGAGGDTDFNARLYGKYLKPILGKPMAIVNVTGGGGSIGARKAKDAKPDGYTALFFHDAMLVNSAVGVADFTFRDFELVAIAGREAGHVVCVKGDSKWNSLKELIEDSAAHPKQYSIAGNIGATTYLMAQLLNKAGADLNIVNHGGAATRITALLGGHVSVIQNPIGTVKSYFQSGDMKPLAIPTAEPNPFAPEIPTIRSLGYKDIVFQGKYFFMFPKGTPKAIVDKLASAVEKVATTDKAYAEEIKKAYLQTPYFKKGQAAFDELVAAEKVVNGVDLKN